MKEKKQKKENTKKHQNYKGEVFVKIMAGFLAILMVAGTAVTLVFALIG